MNCGLKCYDISLRANDNSRRAQGYIATVSDISRDISFQAKYRSNIADSSRLSRFSSIIVCITFDSTVR